MDRLVCRLTARRCFTVDEWHFSDPETYARYREVAETVLGKVRKHYCSYSLYQCFIGNPHQPEFGTSPEVALRRLATREAFQLSPLVNAIYRWFSDFTFTGAVDTLNTLYVVGDATTDADTFANSLLRMFNCVVTAHLNDFSVKDFAPISKTTRLLFFPPVQHAFPFSNPFVGQILKGKEIHVATGEEESAPIRPVKCLVRLKQLPKPENLPTNRREHIILVFAETGSGQAFFQTELGTYIDAIKGRDREQIECQNYYGVLCNASHSYCETCSEPFDIVSVTE
ncbi:ORF09 [Psittacine aviadenovirus B]|uniref:ORF09 n=1 Tax=psittacine adenovirus 4 TaxID=2773287 RepID=A0A1P8SW62_9ADEN|nr:ORF09 [Psittacine aviadenovirus B]APY28344.1 ORF09 [psittacine adenovirus 4]